MKKILSLVLALTAALCFIVSNVSAQTAQKPQEEHGLLYKVSGKDLKKPSYIFGTFHIICSADMLSMEKLSGYLDQTEQLLLEVDLSNAAEVQTLQKSLLIPNGQSLGNFLSPKELAKLDELFKKTVGMPIENIKTLKPFMLEQMLLSSEKVIGCKAPASYDLAFLQAAADKKKTIVGLETMASQVKLIDSQSLQKQAKDLYEIALNPEKSFAEFKTLIETHKKQDSEALYDLVNTQMSKDKVLQSRLFDARNKAWIPKIEKAITEKPSFIAVGGGHLGGENGVIKLLRAKGYKLEAIKLQLAK